MGGRSRSISGGEVRSNGEVLGEVAGEVTGHRATDIEVGVAFFANKEFDECAVFAAPSAHLIGEGVIILDGGHLPDAKDAADFGKLKIGVEEKNLFAEGFGLWGGGGAGGESGGGVR